MRRILMAAALLVLLQESATYADRFVPLNLAQLVEQADQIVVGEAVIDEDFSVVRVSRVLKGKPAKKITTVNRVKSTRVFKNGDQGVFFLKQSGDGGVFPFHPRSYVPSKLLPQVEILLSMKKDPAPYVNLEKYPESENIVYMLGTLFSGFQVTCREFPRLESAFSIKLYYEYVPWNDKSLVVLKGDVSKENKAIVRIETAPPKSPLAEFYRDNLAGFANRLNGVTGPYTLTVDARLPKRVGSLKTTEAIAYLRTRLTSTNPRVVAQAILALAKTRDLDSLDTVWKLVGHKDPSVHWAAEKFVASAKPTPLYEGFEADQALLRKTSVLNTKTVPVNASSPEACRAANRVFARVSFLFRTRAEVLKILGDPATVSDYGQAAGSDKSSPLVYRFDSGWGGLQYTISFRNGQVYRVQVDGLN